MHAGADDFLDDMTQPDRLANGRPANKQVERLQDQPRRLPDKGNGLDYGQAEIGNALRHSVGTVIRPLGIAAVTQKFN